MFLYSAKLNKLRAEVVESEVSYLSSTKSMYHGHGVKAPQLRVTISSYLV